MFIIIAGCYYNDRLQFKVTYLTYSTREFEAVLCTQQPAVSKFKVQVLATLFLRSEFLAIDPEVLGSIPGAYRFSEKQWVWNGVHSAS
jgi:hypothetical protein